MQSHISNKLYKRSYFNKVLTAIDIDFMDILLSHGNCGSLKNINMAFFKLFSEVLNLGLTEFKNEIKTNIN